MDKQIEVFMFIDALGWKIVNRYHFLETLLPYRRKIHMQFGYSCSAVPTILSGKRPQEHGHLSLFYRDPEHSPFKGFRFFRPRGAVGAFCNRGRVRNWLSKIVAHSKGYTGYFQLYSVPFDRLPFFNYCEKHDIFAPGGLAPYENLQDILIKSKLPFHISNWRKSEKENIDAALEAMQNGCDFIFLYTASLDSLLHQQVGNDAVIAEKLLFYQRQIQRLFDAAASQAIEMHFTVISDHGMTPLAGVVDLKKAVEACQLRFGEEYTACYDSTMARFWFHTPEAKTRIEEAVATTGHGRWLSAEEEQKYGIRFEDKKYGDAIYLLDAGWQIVPSDMGAKPLPGMHGFAPEDADSDAVILSNTPFAEENVSSVADFFHLMTGRIRQLQEAKRHGQG